MEKYPLHTSDIVLSMIIAAIRLELLTQVKCQAEISGLEQPLP